MLLAQLEGDEGLPGSGGVDNGGFSRLFQHGGGRTVRRFIMRKKSNSHASRLPSPVCHKINILFPPFPESGCIFAPKWA
jgi:hypothetical protein